MGFEGYIIQILTLIGIFSILTMALNIAMGWTGLFNLAHIGFAGIGAYVWAILVTQYDLHSLLAAIISIFFTATIAFLFSIIIKNIHGDQYDLITLFFGIVIYTILLNWNTVTRGSFGIPGIPQPDFLKNDFNMLVFVGLLTAGLYYIAKHVTQSSFGRALGAVRDDELAAKTLGKNTFALKAKSMVISSAMAGVAGIALALVIRFIDPTTFYLNDLAFVLTALVVGGLASLHGSILGVVILYVITEPIRFLPIGDDILGPLRVIIYALLLIIILIYRPQGFFGKIKLE